MVCGHCTRSGSSSRLPLDLLVRSTAGPWQGRSFIWRSVHSIVDIDWDVDDNELWVGTSKISELRYFNHHGKFMASSR